MIVLPYPLNRLTMRSHKVANRIKGYDLEYKYTRWANVSG